MLRCWIPGTRRSASRGGIPSAIPTSGNGHRVNIVHEQHLTLARRQLTEQFVVVGPRLHGILRLDDHFKVRPARR